MANVRSSKSKMVLAELKRLGGGPFTHEELYEQSATLRREFPESVLLSRRLSDLYNTSDQLDRVQRKSQSGGRKQYAYAYKEAGQPLSRADTGGEAIPESLQHARDLLGLTEETPSTQTRITPSRAPAAPVAAPAAAPKQIPASASRSPKPETPKSIPSPAQAPSENARPAPVAPTVAAKEQAVPLREAPQTRQPVPPVQSTVAYSEPPAGSELSEVLGDLFTDMFSGMMVRMIEQVGPAIREALLAAPHTRVVKEALRQVLIQEEAEAEAEVPVQEEAPERLAPRRKVLIVGLLSQQANVLKTQFGKDLDLSFWNEDRVNDRLQALLDTSQTVFGATKFISHAIDGTLTRAGDYRRVHGGISKLRGELHALLKEEPVPA